MKSRERSPGGDAMWTGSLKPKATVCESSAKFVGVQGPAKVGVKKVPDDSDRISRDAVNDKTNEELDLSAFPLRPFLCQKLRAL